MSDYNIKPYSYRQARLLGVQIRSSTRKDKKIDVFRDNRKIASIGAIGYSDYPTYILTDGLAFAENRRRLYKARHRRTRRKVGTPSWFADKILW